VLPKRQTTSTKLCAIISQKTVTILTAVTTLHLTDLVSLMSVFYGCIHKLIILYHLWPGGLFGHV